MKKLKLRTRLQWGWFKAALFGTALAVLLVPAAGNEPGADIGNQRENPVISMLGSISFGAKVKVIINGDVVALANSEEAGKEAFKAARLAYNAKGVRILNLDVRYEEVDKEKDKETIEGMHVLRGAKLADAVLDSMDSYQDEDKSLAYTMRIDDYTVTAVHMEDLISILEQAQGSYDEEDAFQVGLAPPSSRNAAMYEVKVTKKSDIPEAGDSPAKKDEQTEAGRILPVTEGRELLLTGGEAESSGNSTQAESGEESMGDEEAPESSEEGAGNEEAPESSEENAGNEAAPENGDNPELLAQAANDGVKFVGFSEKIQVMGTYVNKNQIKDRDTVYQELTAKNEEADIYVVEPGDCLSVIAEKNEMSVDEIKALNPEIESDDDIYYDDRLTITVPKAAVQILVERQETYQENYNEDIVYQDDDSMYIGETEVVQEGTPGYHTVTDLVTYKDDMECDREQLEETVEVAAVAQIVRRGTKSKPTYMYPLTIWNITSEFGYRWGRLHAGTDVGVPIGTTVRASRGGQVITAGWVGGYGNCVIIDHGDGVSTRYGHLSEITVSVGQYVDQGEQVALSGNTGRSTGPHLHFEIRINGEAVDPMPYLYQTQ
ncbi:MAG: peptidoglycan DD-metalloendopeptidase family protein [Bacteroidales bacterium]|nr:peptidoglycan DD-metalloendopeptidase family protein [Clostridium sp.]MCM1203403.1 peptidoglycan DD-metalloendopeptidase family protein [Bacteroidales bacterium]